MIYEKFHPYFNPLKKPHITHTTHTHQENSQTLFTVKFMQKKQIIQQMWKTITGMYTVHCKDNAIIIGPLVNFRFLFLFAFYLYCFFSAISKSRHCDSFHPLSPFFERQFLFFLCVISRYMLSISCLSLFITFITIIIRRHHREKRKKDNYTLSLLFSIKKKSVFLWQEWKLT